MLKIGLTGGIASGKSTVAAMFARLGAHLVDADEAARQALAPGSPALAGIRQRFGSGVLAPDGSLDRRALRQVIFADHSARADLNALVHPAIILLIERQLARLAAAHPHGVALLDLPLLYEAGSARDFAAVVVVWIPAAVQKKRLMARDGVSATQARASLGAQMPLNEKRNKAQFVIDNSGSVEETQTQVKTAWMRLLEKTY